MGKSDEDEDGVWVSSTTMVLEEASMTAWCLAVTSSSDGVAAIGSEASLTSPPSYKRTE